MKHWKILAALAIAVGWYHKKRGDQRYYIAPPRRAESVQELKYLYSDESGLM